MSLSSALNEQPQPQQQQQLEYEKTGFCILALHGSEGTAAEFTLDDWKACMSNNRRETINWQVTSLQAPFPKGSGYSWWKLPPNERSFTAVRYDGFEASAKLVQDALASSSFDVLVGHSQGAILLTSLLALGRLDSATATTTFATNSSSSSSSSSRPQRPPRILLNGVAWPNPFGSQLQRVAAGTAAPHNNSSSTHDTAAAQYDILLIMGEKDRINPPEQARKVQQALQQAGHVVQVLEHPGGHALPKDAASVHVIEEWLFRSKGIK